MAEAHQRPRGAGPRTRRSVPEGRAPPPHRAPLRGRARATTRPRSRRTRARSPLDNGNEETLANLERLAMVVNRWPDVAALYDAELDKLAEDAGALRRARPPRSRRSSRCSSRTSTARSRATAACSRSTPRTRPRSARSIGSSRRPSAGPSSRAILAREAEIGQTPDEILEFKYRLGQVQQTASNDVDAAIAAYREVLSAAPEHAGDARGARRRSSPTGIKQVEIGEILEPLYRVDGRVGEARRASTRRSSRTLTGAEERLAAYYRIAELHEEKLLDPVRRARRLHPRAQGVPARREDGRGGRAPRRRRSTAAGRRSRTRTPTSSASTPTPTSSARSASASRATFEDELGDVDEGRGDVPLRPRRRAARRRGAREPRSHLLVARAVARARADPRAARPGDRADDARARRALRAPRRGLRDAPRRHRRTRSARSAASSTSSTRRTTAPSRRSRASTSSKGPGTELNVVYERELENASGDVAEAEIRAKIAHLAADRLGRLRSARSRRGSASSICAARIPRRSRALANLYERAAAVGRARRRPRAPLRHRRERRRPREHPHAARAHLQRASSAATTRRSRTGTASSTSTTRTSRRSAPSPAIRRRQGDPQRARGGAPPDRRSRGGAARRRGAQGDLPRARQDVRRASSQQPFDAADAWRKLLEVDPDFEAMDALEAHLPRRGALDRRHRRQDAARRGARGARREDRRATSRSPRSGASRSATRTRRTPAYEKILEIDADARRGVPRAREAAHGGGALGAAGRALPRAPRDARRDRPRRPSSSARSRASSRSSSTTRTRRSTRSSTRSARTSTTARRLGTSSAWRRPPGRWGELIQTVEQLAASSRPSRTQKIRLCLHLAKWYGEDLGHPEYAQPYYAQIVALDPNNVGALRQMASLYRKSGNWQQLGATLTRALDVAVTDVDRKEILTELGELLDSADEPDRSGASRYYKRALEVDPLLPPGAREPRAHLRGARPEPASSSTSSRARSRRSPSRREIARDQAAHRRALRDDAAATRHGRRRSTARCSRSTPANLHGAARPRARLRRRSSSGPSSCACSSGSSTSSRPSASASTS